MAIVAYHSSTSDPFYLNDARVRVIDYYGVAYYPTAIFDGADDWVVGGGVSAIDDYVDRYGQRISSNVPGVLSMKVAYDPVTLTGDIICRFYLVDQLQNPDLQLRYVLTESHIYHEWTYLDSLHFVVRAMLPGQEGVAFSLNPGETLVDTQSFALDPTWMDDHLQLIAFVQQDSTRNVLVSNQIPLYQNHVSGDVNGDGVVTISDVVSLSRHVFHQGSEPEPSASGDPNEDCAIDAQDIIYLIDYLFYGGGEPLRGWEID